jgi:predicted porin
MKRTLIALALALGATAAFADATLDIQTGKNVTSTRWVNAPEQTSYQSAGIVDDNAPSYPFVP